MALHPIPMPGTPLSRNEDVYAGDAIIIFFEQQVSYTVSQDPPGSSALSPQLPYGTFFPGDYIGPFVVGDHHGTVITLAYSGATFTITIK